MRTQIDTTQGRKEKKNLTLMQSLFHLGITDNALAPSHVSQPIGLLVQIRRSQCQALAQQIGLLMKVRRLMSFECSRRLYL
jgi:hypothetical protein